MLGFSDEEFDVVNILYNEMLEIGNFNTIYVYIYENLFT
jgi:hypothetical protein